MKKLIRFVALLLLILLPAAPSLTAEGSMLTVTGAIEKTNRGPFDPFSDAFIGYHERSFEKAFTLDRQALEALPQVTVTANAEGWPMAVEASGPRLSDLLALVGAAQGASVSLVALDGYAIVLDPEQLSSGDWVLALDAGGEPLALGGRGPLWLLQDTGGDPVPAEQEALWVWSVFLIEVSEN
jgi:hypothetical protein